MGAKATDQPPLDQEFPGIPPLSPASDHASPQLKVTTLPNGLRVATEDSFEPVTSLGLFVDAGSIYESDNTNGASQFMEHMAHKSTIHRSDLRLYRDIEAIGGRYFVASARDNVSHMFETMRDEAETAVEILAESVFHSKLTPWDIDDAAKVVGWVLEDVESSPHVSLLEQTHSAAFTDSSPLGRSMYCPERNLKSINHDVLVDYRDALYRPERMVLVGAGIEHDRLVEYAQKNFPESVAGEGAASPAASPYYGGDSRVKTAGDLAEMTMCFNTGGWKSDSLYPACVLQMLLGGGGSFSAGGPGKGMYSRLYTNVLNRYGFVESATAFNAMYNDTGLIGISGAAVPSHAGAMCDVFVNELRSLAANAPDEEETARAKNMLKSSIMMNLEIRQVKVEDIGRQMLTYGEHESAKDICAKIDAVTAGDIQKVMQDAIKTPLTFAAYGDLSTVPNYHELSAKFA